MTLFLADPAQICIALLALLLLVQLYFIWCIYGRLARYKVKSYADSSDLPPVSVIICAHNEQENLKEFLPLVLTQDYGKYEVIVVNDCSTDDTQWVLQDLAVVYPHLKIVDIKEHIQLKHSKKFALTLGIKAAQHERLILTDADCKPQSVHWLKEMSGAFAEAKEIILGYSPYLKTRGFLNRLIRFETSHTAMSYLSYAIGGNAYMGVGRNLAYTKRLFFRGKGFNAHMHIKSGDDDLFVNHNASPSNVNIAIHPDAHVYSRAKDIWKAYYKQKARHAGASRLYRNNHQSMLATQLVTAVLFYIVLLATLLLYPALWYYPLGIYLLRLISQLIVFRTIYRKLAVPDLLKWLPVLDVLYYFYICTNGLLNRQKKQISW